jgi:hypothetical protein
MSYVSLNRRTCSAIFSRGTMPWTPSAVFVSAVIWIASLVYNKATDWTVVFPIPTVKVCRLVTGLVPEGLPVAAIDFIGVDL